jgi:hypothetical protein
MTWEMRIEYKTGYTIFWSGSLNTMLKRLPSQEEYSKIESVSIYRRGRVS